MKNKFIVTLFAYCLFSVFSGCNAQSSENKYDPNGIHWMSFEEAVKLNDQKPKRIFIDACLKGKSSPLFLLNTH